MFIRNITTLAASVALTFSLGACASVSVKDVTKGQQKQKLARPSQLVVLPFTIESGAVKENSIRRHPGQLAAETQVLLEKYLVAELLKLQLPVTTNPPKSATPNIWIISGKVTRLAEGNRLLRMSFGLGMGGTKMETSVEVHSGRDKVLGFSTTGGSNAMPGAITTPVPFTGTIAALNGAKDGVTADAARTSRMITAVIADRMVQEGWLSPDRAKPKMARP